MKIEGTFQGCDPVTTGVSQSTGRPWQKTYFEILTSEGERSRRVVFGAFGDVVNQAAAVPKGAHVEVRFTAESRDYTDKNGQKRYATDLNCYGIAVITRQSVQTQYPPQPQYPQQQVMPPQYQQPAPTAQPRPQGGPYAAAGTARPASDVSQLPPRNMGLPF